MSNFESISVPQAFTIRHQCNSHEYNKHWGESEPVKQIENLHQKANDSEHFVDQDQNWNHNCVILPCAHLQVQHICFSAKHI